MEPKSGPKTSPKNKTIKKAPVRPAPKRKIDKSMDIPTDGKTVYVGNLRFDKDEQGVKAMFSRYGEVKWVKLVLDPKTGQNKGIAFIEMSTSKEAQKAIKGLNRRVVENRTLKASLAIPKDRPIPPKHEIKSDVSNVTNLTNFKRSKSDSKDGLKSKTMGKTRDERPELGELVHPRKKKKKSGLDALFNYLKKKK